MTHSLNVSATTLALGFALAGCNNQKQVEDPSTPTTSAPESTDDTETLPALSSEVTTRGPALSVPLVPRSDSEISGHVDLIESTSGVLVRVVVNNAEPGLHGVHIHESADCSSPDASSAGGHFNPSDDAHGIPDRTSQHHLGDLGNLRVDPETRSGILEHEVRFADLSDNGDYSFLGRGLIVHSDPDTGGQPSGDSGDRVACAELTQEAASVALETVE